ncbi:hypothetical protein SAMN05444409_1059 [Epilithonimonas zeae]|uniref:Uncharacterized protein n=1 Tax=Epilithonimonas zeae TaxID=1416779 RepID=A0A1N6F5E2_9FLAO|nr:hypothetical protein SAMN05444409_1059 [Epilithonimonas zeae]
MNLVLINNNYVVILIMLIYIFILDFHLYFSLEKVIFKKNYKL